MTRDVDAGAVETPYLDRALAHVCRETNGAVFYAARMEVAALKSLAYGRGSPQAVKVPSEWVAVGERRPDSILTDYLVIDVSGDCHVACYESALAAWIGDNGRVNATHWMPLPAAPQAPEGT